MKVTLLQLEPVFFPSFATPSLVPLCYPKLFPTSLKKKKKIKKK